VATFLLVDSTVSYGSDNTIRHPAYVYVPNCSNRLEL